LQGELFVPFFQEFRKKLCPGLVLGCLLCCATLAQTVSTSYVPGVDFSKYHTYTWVHIKGQNADPVLDAQIKQAVDSQLAARGLRKADNKADLNLDYQTAVTKAKTWQVYEDWSDTTFGGQRFPQRRQVTIDVGTLVIDMYDTASKELVWTGRARKSIHLNNSREDRQQNLDKAAKQLLADFPPK